MKKVVKISFLLGAILGSIFFYLGYKYGEQASKNMIQDSAYMKNIDSD